MAVATVGAVDFISFFGIAESRLYIEPFIGAEVQRRQVRGNVLVILARSTVFRCLSENQCPMAVSGASRGHGFESAVLVIDPLFICPGLCELIRRG
jgi:hypothetical protein